MKISMGSNIQPGPWGGGNQFARSLADHLSQAGHQVSFDLSDPELDLILLTEPDPKLKVSAFNHRQILRYLLFTNSRAVVAHRVNNSSETKGQASGEFNRFRINANLVADHTIFISQWLWQTYRRWGYDRAETSVILNGGDASLWKPAPARERAGRLSLVTHHWSDHPNKGWDIYERLDSLLASPEWSDKLSFTYLGNPPKGRALPHSRVMEPLGGEELAAELRRHDIYLTAAINEPAGMHHIEGALCGLPLLYRRSGALPEYCQGFGIAFDESDFEQSLRAMLTEHEKWRARLAQYPHVSQRMCQEYLDLFVALIQRKTQLMAKRRFWSRPWWAAKVLAGR